MKKGSLHFILLACLCSLISCATLREGSYHPEEKLSPDDSKQDLALLKSILEANHPSLYWYTTKDSIDWAFNTAAAAIKDSVTELQLKNKVAWVINKIHCGHTSVRSSKKYNRYYEHKRRPQFPLSLKVWDDSIIVVNNNSRGDSALKRGTAITGINGYSNRKLLDSMFQFISTDGYTNNFKQQVISFNFPFYYTNTFGLDSLYTINYIDANGNSKTTHIKNFIPRVDTGKKPAADSLPRISRKQFREFKLMTSRSLLIDTSISTAILKLNTFSATRLKTFFKRSFKKLRKDNIQNLVVDVRENGGGDILSGTRLTQYIIDHPFRVADTVAANGRSFKYHQYIKPWMIYWLSMHVMGRRHSDGRVHFNYFENHFFKPKKKNHFNGDTYIVEGGYSFSATTLFAGALKGQKNVKLVGEETGGGSYGNTAMHLPIITLPKSRIRIVLPLYRIIVNHNRPKTSRGIFPDVQVGPSSTAIKQGVDLKMEKVREMILKKKH